MSTLFVAVILVVSIIAFIWIFNRIDKKRRNKRIALHFDQFTRIASGYEMVITRHEIFSNKIIGLDAMKKKFLVFDYTEAAHPTVINLADLHNCTLVKEYDHLNAGDESKPRMERYLHSIDLRFNSNNNETPVSISLYENHVHGIDQMVELEARGKEWQTILSDTMKKGTQTGITGWQ